MDKVFDQIRRKILRQEQLLNLEECYSLIRCEAIRSTILNEEFEQPEASVMVSWNQTSQSSQDRTKSNNSKNSNNSEKSSYKCTHCNKKGHTKSRCFELVGYPYWWDSTRHRNSKRPSTANVQTIKEEDAIKTAIASVTTINIDGKVLNTSTPVLNSAWLIDSSVIDHMTFDIRQVSSLNPSSQNCVSTANVNTTPVIREWSSHLINTLHLDSVLVVPSLNYNLLSVSQITATLSCVVIFWPTFLCLRTFRHDK